MSYDAEGVRRAVHDLLVAIGEDPERDGLRDTPERMARATRRCSLASTRTRPSTLSGSSTSGSEEMVLVRDIPMYSVCEHHLLPFHGSAHVGYIPGEDGRVTGLSKVARLVDGYARRPQVQERLTRQIADALVERLQCRGVLVVVEAEHLCMSMRGVAQARLQHGHLRRARHHAQRRHRSEAMSLVLGRRS